LYLSIIFSVNASNCSPIQFKSPTALYCFPLINIINLSPPEYFLYTLQWEGWAIIDEFKALHGSIPRNTKLEIPELTGLVKDLYRKVFYDANNINEIQNGSLQEIIFDWCVNSGRYGSKGVQKVLNSDFEYSLKVDGIIGN